VDQNDASKKKRYQPRKRDQDPGTPPFMLKASTIRMIPDATRAAPRANVRAARRRWARLTLPRAVSPATIAKRVKRRPRVKPAPH
jgi:hypothetical protein